MRRLVVTLLLAGLFLGVQTSTSYAKEIVYKDDVVTVLKIDSGTVRVDTRTMEIMEIDITEAGENVNGFVVGQPYTDSASLEKISSVEFKDSVYHSYKYNDEQILRVCTIGGTVTEISIIVNV